MSRLNKPSKERRRLELERLERRDLLAAAQPVASDDSFETPLETQLIIPAASGVLQNDVLIYQESFEDEPGTSYAIEFPFDEGLAFLDRFAVPDNSHPARDDFQFGFDGGFAIMGQNFNFEGRDATRTVAVLGLDVAGGTDLQATISLGANPGGFEGADGIKIFAALDASFPGTLIAEFAPPVSGGDLQLDTNGDGVGDGVALGTTLTDFTFPISETGIVLDITIDVTSDDTSELIAIDNLRVQVSDVGTAENAQTPTANDGSVELSSDGSFIYNPPSGFSGNDTFRYDYSAGGTTDTGTVTITVGSPVDLDFGDAPAAADSGLDNDYPVTVAQDGARHIIGSLFLGESVDADADGQPDDQAGQDASGGDDNDGQDDEDGVTQLAAAIASDISNTTSSFAVVASEAGRLDAWIDFNRNGSWDDAGEMIFSGVDVRAGTNALSYSIPAGSTPGGTGARFRLSSTGGLDPTGEAGDGEVEDYVVDLLPPGNNSVEITAAGSGETIAEIVGNDLVIRNGPTVLFRAPTSALSDLLLVGTNGDDTFRINAGLDVLAGGFGFQAAAGNDTLVLAGQDQTLDLTAPQGPEFSGLESIDLSGSGANSLIVDRQSVIAATDARDVVVLVHDENDQVQYDGALWEVEAPIFVNGAQRHVLTNGPASVETINTLPHQNPLTPTDVNFSGGTSSLDALQIINFIGRSGLPSVDLPSPTSASELPERYFDTNGSGTATSLDALVVINFQGRQRVAGEGEGGEALPLTAIAPLRQSPDAWWLNSRTDSRLRRVAEIDAVIGDANGNWTLDLIDDRLDPLNSDDADDESAEEVPSANRALDELTLHNRWRRVDDASL